MKQKLSGVVGFPYKGQSITVGVLRPFWPASGPPTSGVGVISRLTGVNKEFEQALPFIEAYKAVDEFNNERKSNIVLIGPEAADYLLIETEHWNNIADGAPFPVNIVVGYEAQGKKFGSEIVTRYNKEKRLILPTGEYKGEKGITVAALNLTAADFKREGSDIRIDVPKERLAALPELPVREGWYLTDAKTTIPYGKAVTNEIERGKLIARFLYPSGGPNIATIVRSVGREIGGVMVGGRADLALIGIEASNKFGVVVEIHDEASKIRALE